MLYHSKDETLTSFLYPLSPFIYYIDFIEKEVCLWWNLCWIMFLLLFNFLL